MSRLEVGQYVTITEIECAYEWEYPFLGETVQVKEVTDTSVTVTGRNGDYTVPGIAMNNATILIEDDTYVPVWAENTAPDAKLESIAGTLERALDAARDTERIPVAASTQPTRSFIHFDRAWYAEANRAAVNLEFVDDITLEIEDMAGEIHIEWEQVHQLIYPRLIVYDNRWALLAAMPDVIALLASLNDQNVQPLTLCKRLEGLGFVDATETVNPNSAIPPRWDRPYDGSEGV